MRIPLTLAAFLVTGLVLACTRVPLGLGETTYRDYCVSCHGTAGKGDGPLAAGLSRAPADLTTITARHGGTFPLAAVMSQIDGYSRGLHGAAGDDAMVMPEFGTILAGKTVLYDVGDGIDTPTPERLAALAEYLRSLQRAPL